MSSFFEDLHLTRCLVCDTHVFLNDDNENEHGIEEEEQPTTVDHTSTRISRLYDTNEEFRNDVKKYRDALYGVSRPRKEFQNLLRAKKREIAPGNALLKAQAKALYTGKKNELMHSNEYKAARSADRKYIKYCTMLRTKYNVGPRMLAHLGTRPGCKSLRRPYAAWYSYSRLIRRALRLRLPWW